MGRRGTRRRLPGGEGRGGEGRGGEGERERGREGGREGRRGGRDSDTSAQLATSSLLFT